MKQLNPCKIRLWERKGENRNCLFCKKDFYVPRSLSQKGGGKYCSRSCYYENKKTGELKNCLVCNKQFYAQRCFVKVGWGKYCSRECRSKVPVTDEIKEKIAIGHRGEKSYLWRGGRKTINKTRLETYQWRAIRKVAYERDNWKCQECSKQCDRTNIACHHKVPWRITRDDSLDNLITLCNSCHSKTENYLRFKLFI